MGVMEDLAVPPVFYSKGSWGPLEGFQAVQEGPVARQICVFQKMTLVR